MNITLLLSRQSLYLSGNSLWIKKAVETIQSVKALNYTLVSSVGLSTWEVLICLGKIHSIPMKVYIPVNNLDQYEQKKQYYKEQFENDPIIEFLPFVKDENNQLTLDIQRDQYILQISEKIFPVSIRKNGVLNSLISNYMEKTDTTYQIPYYKKDRLIKKEYTKRIFNPEINHFKNQYLFHWTRACKSKWPHETLFTYYNDVVECKGNPRDAFSTLCSIMNQNVIFSSKRHLSNGCQCVSFTGKAPADFINNMRWRARYKEMSFEAYGIGIRKDVAVSKGIVKIEYLDELDLKKIKLTDRWMYQSKGLIGDWTQEEEYRCTNDFYFGDIPENAICCITENRVESQELREKFKIKSVNLFDD
jgi:hypothetical protein